MITNHYLQEPSNEMTLKFKIRYSLLKKCLHLIFFLIAANLPGFAQDQYDPKKALDSEALFLKQNENRKIIGVPGQKYITLDVSPLIGKIRRYRFFTGDKINFRLRNDKSKFKTTLNSITDSSFTISRYSDGAGTIDYTEIQLKNVRQIKISKRIPFVSEASYYFPMAGVLFIGADLINKGSDNKRYTTDASTLIVGGALMAAGFLCYKLSFAPYKINQRNKLKVMEAY